MMEENCVVESVPEDIQAVIAAALSRYLQDEKLSFKVIAIKPVQSSQINFWGIVGRRDNMMNLPR
jgi:ribosome-binding factor A